MSALTRRTTKVLEASGPGGTTISRAIGAASSA